MKNSGIVILSAVLIFLTGCLTSKKMDRFVAEQYNNQLPKPTKSKAADILITSSLADGSANISHTVQKTSKVLPLILYWQYDYRHTCTLNPTIPVTGFSNAVSTMAGKGLTQKLNGKKLQLTVEQIPNTFALVDKAHVIWLVYAFGWDKIYMEPGAGNLIVSYQLLENDKPVKAGRITVENDSRNKGIRYFQSWKSATSEHLADYNIRITNMTRSFISKLMEEI
jgi:hypothetical protein